MKRTDVMVDIETVGRGRDAVVASVGLVMIDMVKLEVDLQSSRHWALEWETQVEQGGRKLDPNTIQWWMKQEELPREVLLTNQVPTWEALAEIGAVIKTADYVWANPAAFDLKILGSLYRSYCMDPPWSWRQALCMRGLENGFRLVREHEWWDAPNEVKHCAEHDAIAQAQELVHVLRAIKGVKA